MASLRGATFAVVGGLIGTLTIAGTFLAGCGDDSGTDAGGPQNEAGPDSTMAVDSAVPDAGHDTGADARDSGAIDSTVGDADAAHDGDSGSVVDGDAGAHDADAAVEADAAHDADAAVEGDAAHDADAATPFDAANEADVLNPVQQFVQQYAAAFCGFQFHCCDGFDSGSFDASSCVTQTINSGASLEGTLPGSQAAYAAGHLQLNDAGAAGCLAALPTVPCGTITAADNAAITNACFGVFVGTIPLNGSGCISSFECAAGSFCSRPDGGVGACTALVGDGGACSSQDMCTQASLVPTSFCDSVLDGGTSGTCQPLLPDNAPCDINDLACASEFCFAGVNQDQCGGTFANPNVGDSGSCP